MRVTLKKKKENQCTLGFSLSYVMDLCYEKTDAVHFENHFVGPLEDLKRQQSQIIKPFQIMLKCYFPELWYLGSEI